jgi:RNase adaptor protein for sRNA GlmZ degradation
MSRRGPSLSSSAGCPAAARALPSMRSRIWLLLRRQPARRLAGACRARSEQPDRYPRVAIGIDARTGPEGLERLPELLDDLPATERFPAAVSRYRFAGADSALQRNAAPASAGRPRRLEAAIEAERRLLAPIRERADWVIDTSESNIHQLRRQVWRTIGVTETSRCSRWCWSPSPSSAACRAMSIWCSMPAACPTRTGNRNCAPIPGWKKPAEYLEAQ